MIIDELRTLLSRDGVTPADLKTAGTLFGQLLSLSVYSRANVSSLEPLVGVAGQLLSLNYANAWRQLGVSDIDRLLAQIERLGKMAAQGVPLGGERTDVGGDNINLFLFANTGFGGDVAVSRDDNAVTIPSNVIDTNGEL